MVNPWTPPAHSPVESTPERSGPLSHCCDAALCLLQAKFERLQKKIEAVEQAKTKKVNEDIMTQEIRLLKTIVAMEAAAAESP